MSTFYITTPIYYVNDVPHLGHAYTTIIADALARFHRAAHHAAGDHTRMLTGTDEHGQKIEEAAHKRGLTPQQLTDDVSPRFSQAWQQLNISNDDFIRTTEPRHKAVVAELWRRIDAAGDMYLASYDGWYCVGCEAFYTESQLVKMPSEGDGWYCPDHKRPVAWVAKERSWFFRMAKYQAALLAHIESHPDFIRPVGYRNEIVSFLKSGLRDLSVSRTSFAWGITPPSNDPEGLPHVIYVWLDALTNYLSALCDVNADGTVNLDSAMAKTYWPEAVHLIGKDILRFHAVYWPCFLLSAGLPLPKSIVCHGWWTVRGEKISKSLPATRIDPVVLAKALANGAPLGDQIGVDAMRYYLLREVPLGNDGDFTLESLFARYNAELANDLGNLINRSITLLQKFGGQFPPTYRQVAHAESQRGLQQAIEELLTTTARDAATQFAEFTPSRALETIWRFVREGNRYVDMSAPWAQAKKAATGDTAAVEDLQLTLHTMRGLLIAIADLIAPVLPTSATTLLGWLGVTRAPQWPAGAVALQETPASSWATEITPLFPRFDDATMAKISALVLPVETAAAPAIEAPAAVPAKASATKAPAAALAPISYDDFMKTELRVGKVVSATAIPKAKKLLHLFVDVGEAAPRSVVAGIAEAYPPADLVGKNVLVVTNLAPATIRGVESHGMILAAGDDAILGLSAVDRDVPPGTRVR